MIDVLTNKEDYVLISRWMKVEEKEGKTGRRGRRRETYLKFETQEQVWEEVV